MLHVEWYHVCWPRLTAKRVEPVVSISWASCCLPDTVSTWWDHKNQSISQSVRRREQCCKSYMSHIMTKIHVHRIYNHQTCSSVFNTTYIAGPPLPNGRCTSLLSPPPVSEMTYTVSSGTAVYHTIPLMPLLLITEKYQHRKLPENSTVIKVCGLMIG